MDEAEAKNKVKRQWPQAHCRAPHPLHPTCVVHADHPMRHFLVMGTRSRRGYSYQYLGSGLSEGEAWIDSATRMRREPDAHLGATGDRAHRNQLLTACAFAKVFMDAADRELRGASSADRIEAQAQLTAALNQLEDAHVPDLH